MLCVIEDYIIIFLIYIISSVIAITSENIG